MFRSASEEAEHESWEVENCIDGDAALEELVGHRQYDLLLVNFELPVLNGLELIAMQKRAKD